MLWNSKTKPFSQSRHTYDPVIQSKKIFGRLRYFLHFYQTMLYQAIKTSFIFVKENFPGYHPKLIENGIACGFCVYVFSFSIL